MKYSDTPRLIERIGVWLWHIRNLPDLMADLSNRFEDAELEIVRLRERISVLEEKISRSQ